MEALKSSVCRVPLINSVRRLARIFQPDFGGNEYLMRHTKHMRNFRRRRGVLTLEWVLLITVVVIGIIGGLGAVRNAIVSELQDVAEAIQSLNVTPESESESEGVLDDMVPGH